MKRLIEKLAPWLLFAAAIGAWEITVRVREIAPYILPAPSVIAATAISDWPLLWAALLVTLRTTFLALLLASFGGLALALLFARWRWVERSLFPFAVVLQVTPIIAIAPLLLVYLETDAAVLTCAFIVAFFPFCPIPCLACARLIAIWSNYTSFTAPRAGSNCGCCVCPPRCRTLWAACASAAALR